MMRGHSPSPGPEPDLAAYWDAKLKSLMRNAPTPPPPPPPQPAARAPSPSPSSSSSSSSSASSASPPPSPPPPPPPAPQQQQKQKQQQLANSLPKKPVLTAQQQHETGRPSEEIRRAHKKPRSKKKRAERELKRLKKAEHPAVRGAVEDTSKAEKKDGLAPLGGGVSKTKKKK